MITKDSPIAFSDPLPEAVDVVVIGAGIIGTGTAWFLARGGLKVLLCEKGRVAGEQSSRNWGWVRQQGRDPAELPIMMESNRIWRGLAEEAGDSDLDFSMCGCLYLAEDAKGLGKFESWHEIAKQHGLDTQMLSKKALAKSAPGVNGQWVGGMLTPSDGRAEPFVAVPALARAARGLGVSVVENCAVRTVESEGGSIKAVWTENGRVRAGAVVLTGGAWSTYFASNLGLDIPQLMVRSTAGRTHPAPKVELPNVSMPGFAMRRRADGGYTLATGDVAEHYLSPNSFRYLGKYLKLLGISAKDVRLRLRMPTGYPGGWGESTCWRGDEESPFERMRVLDPPASELASKRLRARLPLRAPWVAAAGIAEVWAGMIDVTPDAVPYICEAPEPKGLFIGTGMSGHGFGIGPGVGRVLADLVRGQPPGHDITRFRFNRFSDGTPIVPGPY